MLNKLGLEGFRSFQEKNRIQRLKNGRDKLFSEGITELLDINYLNDGNNRHTLDIVSKDLSKKAPVIIEVHGGAWITCEKNINLLHARYYATKGFHVVNMDYTLHPEGSFKQNLEEIVAVINFIVENKDKYNFDIDRIYLSGDSAGGHFVLLYGMLQGSKIVQNYYKVKLPKAKILKIAATCPATHVSKNRTKSSLFNLIFDYKPSEDEMIMLDIEYLSSFSNLVPVYIVSTPQDVLIYDDYSRLDEVFKANNKDYIYKEYTKIENDLEHVFNVLYPEWIESKKANDDIINFFNE